MKFRHFAPLNVSVIVFVVACASSGPQREPADSKTLTADEIEKHAHEPVEIMLMRKFPGVQVLRNADGDISLQIRGMTSVTGTPKQPLYVVNGMEMEPGGRGLLSIVNPYDIETIKVLKGAEAAIYGVRGADGVIVIRTKGTLQQIQAN